MHEQPTYRMTSQPSTNNPPDPEAVAQRNELHGASRVTRGVIWLAFCLFAGWARFQGWRNQQRRCAWCERHLAGNPFAKRISHGICRSCMDDFTHGQEAAAPAVPHPPKTASVASSVGSL